MTGDLPRLAPATPTLLLLALAIFGVPLLLGLPLIDPDEGLHAAIAQEMVERGNYVVPTFLGVPFLDKPILFFLAQAASIALFGATEFAVRLPGQAFGLLGAITTGLLAATLAGRQAGLVAGAIYATLAFPMVLAQAAVHDIALVPWTTLALASFLVAMRGRADVRAVFGWCALAGVSLGLAVLTKGLTGLALVGLPVVALAALERKLTLRLILGGAAAVAVALAVGLPWYLAVERAQPGFLHYFFVERHLLGYATTTQMHGHREWWYYVPVLLAGSVPWIMTAPGAVPRHTDTRHALRSLARVGVVWLIVDLVFLSVAGSKLATYLLPLFPAVAIMVAAAWLGVPWRDRQAPAPAFARLLGLHGFAGAVLPLAACAWASWLTGVTVPRVAWVVAAVVSAGWMALAWLAPRWPLRRTFAASLAGMALILLGAYATLFPTAAAESSARDLAAHFNRRGELPPRLWIVDERIGSFVFYLDPPLRASLSPDRVDGVSLPRALIDGIGVPGTMVALPSRPFTKLSQRVDIETLTYEEAGRYRLFQAADLRHAQPRVSR